MRSISKKAKHKTVASMRRGQVPEYFDKLPKVSEQDEWKYIEDKFREDCYWLLIWRVESKDEYLQKIARSDRTIPYSSDETLEEVNELLHYSRLWVPRLEKLITAQKNSVQFLTLWGAFNNALGRIYTLWSLKPDTSGALTGSETSRKKTNKRNHRIWYAHAFLTLKDEHPNLTRKDLDGKVTQHIFVLLEKNFMFEEGYGSKWFMGFFENFVANDKQYRESKDDSFSRFEWHFLTASFKHNKLSIKKMKQLVDENPVVVPRTNLI